MDVQSELHLNNLRQPARAHRPVLDQVGLDTASHVSDFLRTAFGERVGGDETILHRLTGAGRLGQKNGRGYYKYEADKKGRPKKIVDEGIVALLAPIIDGSETLDDETIADAMMIPMCLEAVRCLEDGIAASATDVDLALIYGIGFPPFRGGALHYMDDLGIDRFVARADELAAAGVPVLLEPLANLPSNFDRLGARLDNAALLNEAGVNVVFSGAGTHNARKQRQAAGNAVANGLPWDAALAALIAAGRRRGVR